MACKTIRYTQNSCSDTFVCGTPLRQTINGIVTGHIDPATAKYMVLDVVSMKGNMYSIDNRRLFCMRAAEVILGQPIFASVRVYDLASLLNIYVNRDWTPDSSSVFSVLERFIAHFTTWDDGESIDIRRYDGCHYFDAVV